MINNPAIPPVDRFKAFDAWVSKTVDTVYEAEADGIVIATSEVGGDKQLNGYTSTNVVPTLKISSNTATTASAKNSLTMPVKKGDHWKVSGNVTVLWWLPFKLTTTE